MLEHGEARNAVRSLYGSQEKHGSNTATKSNISGILRAHKRKPNAGSKPESMANMWRCYTRVVHLIVQLWQLKKRPAAMSRE